ncbi:hypothetical protein [Cohaesibacter celericrescens]|uniref:hypothetical protein n=1 Tax=Cohaesibacter celericrescens TaxID=2067669 RepID=UPI001AECE601|nr:hypothetical protein [Cohaesibacter celericrescens]
MLMGTKVDLLVGFVTTILPLCAAIAVYYVPRMSEKLQERRYDASITFMSGAIGSAVSGLVDSIPLIAIVALCVAEVTAMGSLMLLSCVVSALKSR